MTLPKALPNDLMDSLLSNYKKPLLNDIFTGDSGFYVYEELPRNNTKSGIASRGLEGFGDAVMKVFGI